MPRVFRATSLLALSVCAFAVTGCGDDPFTVRAQFQTVADSFAIQTLTRTPASARALWRIGTFSRFRLDSIGEQFDLGFDIDASGRVVVVPARRITVTLPGATVAPPSVSLLLSPTAYATLDRAPESGYSADSSVVVTIGQTVVVRSQSNFCSRQTTGGTLLYTKFVIDTVDAIARRLVLRATIQPNCNFRSFATGIPTF